MQRSEVLNRLRTELPALQKSFGVKTVSIIGSVSRDEANEASDLDLLVRFDGSPTLAAYMGLTRHLENLFGVRVDIATPDGLSPGMRQWVEQEATHVS